MNSRAALATVLLVLSMLSYSGCEREVTWILREYESDRYSLSDFLHGIGTFPYAAEEAKVLRIKVGWGRLALGMRKEEVQKLLGDPDAEMLRYRPQDSGERFVSSTWIYYLKLFDRKMPRDDFDQLIVLHFKPSDELYWADPGVVFDLQSLGGPDFFPEATPIVKR